MTTVCRQLEGIPDVAATSAARMAWVGVVGILQVCAVEDADRTSLPSPPLRLLELSACVRGPAWKPPLEKTPREDDRADEERLTQLIAVGPPSEPVYMMALSLQRALPMARDEEAVSGVGTPRAGQPLSDRNNVLAAGSFSRPEPGGTVVATLAVLATLSTSASSSGQLSDLAEWSVGIRPSRSCLPFSTCRRCPILLKPIARRSTALRFCKVRPLILRSFNWRAASGGTPKESAQPWT